MCLFEWESPAQIKRLGKYDNYKLFITLVILWEEKNTICLKFTKIKSG